MIKKIVLTVFFSIFVCVFIGFNYLLIQKESADIGTVELEQEMTAKSATITSQVARISELEGRTSDLIEQIATLREQGEGKDETIATYEKETQESAELLGKREDLINKLKQGLDVELVGQQAREWIEFINNGEYDKSYARFSKAIDNAYTTMIFSEFRAYYAKQVGMVEVKSIDVMTRGIPDTIDNDLVVAVVVDLITPRSLELFYESLDERRAIAQAEADAEAARLAAEAANELLEQLREAANKQNNNGGDGEDGEGNVDGAVDDGEGDNEGDDAKGVGNVGDGEKNVDGEAGGDGLPGGVAGDGEENADGVVGADRGEGSGQNGAQGSDNPVDGADDYARAAGNGAGDANNAANDNIDVGNNGTVSSGRSADYKNGDIENGNIDHEGGESAVEPNGAPDGEPDESSNGSLEEPPEGEGIAEEEADPFDKENFISAGAVLAAMAEYEYIYTDDLDDSIFNTGENQFIFLMNYKKEANDWEIIRIVQKL